jgi:twitching motility protein PilT
MEDSRGSVRRQSPNRPGVCENGTPSHNLSLRIGEKPPESFEIPAGMSLAPAAGLMLTMSTESPRDAFTSATLETPAAAPVAADQLGGSVAPAVREPAINAMFRRMCELKASDLHMSATVPPLVRKDGEMRRLHDAAGPLSSDMIMQLLVEIMPSVNQAEFEARHDTDFAYEIAGLARFRANVFRDRQGAGAVFRVIPSNILTAEQLGLSSHILDLCKLTKGLVLVTGPTGSGKSTTLCAMIDYINRTRTDHIITIEDPIEFVHQNQKCLINQREVHNHTRSFKDALRAALREDPDVLLVGELRDLETIAIAIETAETGHLVFGTLHTTTAASTVDRVIDQFPADRQAQIRVMLSESLRGVIAQTLCRKVGGGRVAALEVLLTNGAISNLIREGKTFQIPSMMQVGRAQGMVSLNDALADLVKKGLVAPEEALLRAVDKAGLDTLLKRQPAAKA